MKIKLGLTNFLMDFFLKGKPGITWSKDDLKNPVQKMQTVFARPDVPADAPDDLKDSYAHLILDANGKRVTGSLLLSFLVGGGATLHRSPAIPLFLAWLFFARILMVVPMVLASFLPGWWALLLIVPALVLYSMEHVQAGLGYGFTGSSGGKLGFVGNVFKIALFAAIIYAPWWVRLAIWPWIPFMAAYKMLPGVRNLATIEQELADQDFHFNRGNTLITTPAYIAEYKEHVEGRKRQAAVCKADATPYLNYGFTATGIMTSLGSLNSPDKGMLMGETVKQLCPGMIAFGPPGSGKTTGVLRPLMYELYAAQERTGQKVGMFVLDNKAGALPMEAAMLIPGFKLITPVDKVLPNGAVLKATPFAMMNGLNADEAAETMSKLLSKGDKSIWPGAGVRLMSKFFLILEVAARLYKEGRLLPLDTLMPYETKDESGQKVTKMVPANTVILEESWLKWNVINAVRLLSDVKLVAALTFLIPSSEFDKDDHLYQAACYRDEYLSLSDATRTSIQMTATTWTNAMTGNREMRNWLTAADDDGVNVEDVFQGAHMGLYCPFNKFGIPGTVAEEFAKYRLYKFAQSRGDEAIWSKTPGQTYAVIIEDEFQNNIGTGEQLSAIAPMMRSLGLGYVGATQSYEGIESRIGAPQTEALLDVFRNLVGMGNMSEKTQTYFTKRLGTVAKIKPCVSADEEKQACGIGFESSCIAISQGARGNTELYDQERLENTTVSYNEGTSGPNMAGTNPLSRFMVAEANMFSIMKSSNNVGSVSRGSSLSYKHVSNENVHKRFVHGVKVMMQNMPVYEKEQHGRILYTSRKALVLLNRGEHPRLDIVETSRVSSPDLEKIRQMEEGTTIESV